MRGIGRAPLLVCLLAAPLLPGPIPLAEYRERRAGLRHDLRGTLVLFGASEGSDAVYRFRQESNFLYLTGWDEPGARLLLTHDLEMLFLPHHDERRERYSGRRLSASGADAPSRTGFDSVLPIEKFESQLAGALDAAPEVYVLAGDARLELLKPLLGLREPRDAAALIAKLRSVKSPAEIAAIQRSTDVTLAAHRAAWKRLAPGAHEYDLSAAFTDAILSAGCEGYAYSPIVGSGPNGAVLHYTANTRRMDRGDLVVMDAAARCDRYASDITRTVPVTGVFTARQREIYEIVLGAQKAAIAAIKPGAQFSDIDKIARAYIASHGKDIHGQPLDKYFTHGIGHFTGLDVHDPPGARGLALEENMVLTVEPGIYLSEESMGVRIEDVVLVTHDGAKVLSQALPREPEEIEKALAH